MRTTHPQRTTSRPRIYGQLIGGEERGAPQSELIDRHSPATGEVIARFASGTEEDAGAAVAAAREAFDRGPWPRLAPLERSRALYRLAQLIERDKERLAQIDAEEVGKPIRLARGDIDGAIGLTEYAAGLAQQVTGETHDLGANFNAFVMREPIGVAALIIPWNFPALICQQKLPFALAAGCTAVVKPSEMTSGSALEIARLAMEAGIPDGVVNVVTGFGDPVGQHLAESHDVDIISFTGSTATGQRVQRAAAASVKKVHLELGGKAANIVFADADLEDAVDGTLFAVNFNQGECCVSGARLLVEDSVADEFIERVRELAGQVKVGHPLDEDADVAAMIHEPHMEKVLNYIEEGKTHGARVITGGERLRDGGFGDGFFVQPTVIDNVEPDMPIFQEEIFGPVLTVTRFKDREEAVALANAVDYGLANAVWTQDLDTAFEVSKGLRSGTVWINTQIDGAPQLPFGGYKASGYGREMGLEGMLEYTQLKTIQVRTGKRTPYYDIGS